MISVRMIRNRLRDVLAEHRAELEKVEVPGE